ncbi:sialate O-acetylesterase [Kiritimatiellota bacterium B12222]|nr:sialate O-acetylesterase [Kiritimatiellota bacterium B12222]
MNYLITLLLFFPFFLCAELSVPHIFSDHMVLQRDRTVPVWGKAEPGDTIRVDIGDVQMETVAGLDGRWRVDFPPRPASFDPVRIKVSDGTQTLVFEDVLVGEVWLCSGQSNMEFRTLSSKDGDLELAMATHPEIRLYKVERATAQEPRFSASALWQVASSESVADFSAVGYFFGRDLRQVLDVPLGLIDASWGGTPAIAWTRNEAMDSHPLLTEKALEWEEMLVDYDEREAAWKVKRDAWMEKKGFIFEALDTGVDPKAADWHTVGVDTQDWQAVVLPTSIEAVYGKMDGAVWFRRTVSLPASMRGQALTLSLGRIADYEQTWVNGVRVGGTDRSMGDAYKWVRTYPVPAALTEGDELVITVRVFDRWSTGGFVGASASMFLRGETEELTLAGPGWTARIETRVGNVLPPWQYKHWQDAPKGPLSPDDQNRPANLAYGMLGPVAPYALRGAIWYQGESDAGWEPARYGERLRVMIEDWRLWWGIPDLEFGVVQLANYQQPQFEVSDSAWARLRESQRQLVRELPHSGLAVTIDIGEADDIHPLNKQEVARRLARWALTDVYGRLLLRGGPEAESVQFAEGKALIRFSQIGTGLRALNGPALHGFTVAGGDGVFVPAQASIEGKDAVRVFSDAVPEPVHVRYAWQMNPVQANLSNRERLPAGPFELMREDVETK